MEIEKQEVVVVSTPTNVGPGHFSWILSPVVITVFSISVIGSVSIFFLVCLSKTFRRTSNYLVANLCVASVYHIIVNILYTFQNDGLILVKYGLTTCQLLAFFNRLPFPVLPLTIAFISLDRSVVARNPLDYPSRGTAFIKILFIWLFSMLLLVPRASMSSYDESVKSSFKCTKVLLWNSLFLHSFYAVITLVVIYIVPTYILIKGLDTRLNRITQLKELERGILISEIKFLAMRCQMKFLTMSQVEHRKRFQRRLRVMKNACIFTSIFVTCWLPMGIFQFPFDLPEVYTRTIVDFFGNFQILNLVKIRDFFRMVSIFTSCLHPILLLVLSFDIREFLSSSCYV